MITMEIEEGSLAEESGSVRPENDNGTIAPFTRSNPDYLNRVGMRVSAVHTRNHELD